MSHDLSEQFDLGRRYAAMLGPLPAFVGHAVRGVRNAQQLFAARNPDELARAVYEVCKRLFKASPTYKAVLYFAAREIYPDKLAAYEHVGVKELIHLFPPEELSAVVVLVYFMRHVGKNATDVDRAAFDSRLRQQMALGRIVGARLDQLGSGNGILIGGIRACALMQLLVQDDKARREYRRRTTASKKLYDLDFERETYGTTHLFLAGAMLQMAGFGVHAVAGLTSAYDDLEALAPEARAWARAVRAIEELALSRSPYEGVTFDEYFKPDREAMPAFRDEVTDVLTRANCFDWINRTKDDLFLALDEKLEEDE